MGPAKAKKKVDPGVAAIIAAVILAVAGISGAVGRVTASTDPNKASPSPSPAPTVTRTVTPAPQAVHLSFSQSSTAVVPWCNTFTGTGSIPQGDSLLIFDSQLGPGGQPLEQSLHYFDGTATQTSNDAWSIYPVYIGDKRDKDLYVAIDAVLVSNRTADFIKSVTPESIDPANTQLVWKSKVLPPGLAKNAHLVVVRNSNTRQCAS